MASKGKINSEKNLQGGKPHPSPRNEMKTIIIEYNDTLKTEISFLRTLQNQLDCGWLFRQAVKQLSEEAVVKNVSIDLENIIALRTKSNNYTLDHWLTFPERSVAPINDGSILVAYIKDTTVSTERRSFNEGDASSVSFKDFDLLAKIGKGGYSRVYLARKKQSGRLYAIKVISKKIGDSEDRVKKAVLRERKNFLNLESEPYMLHLRFCFQTEKSYCFVMDFMPGSDLYHHICRRKFTEEDTKFYAMEILLRLESLHALNYIFRDLKPENLLLDIDGHINFADFGFLKRVSRRTSMNYSYRGTPVYMAPEVINKTGYNFLADYYSFGCVIYEMMCGKPPFVAASKHELFDRVLHQDPVIPHTWSVELQDFVSGLLEKCPEDRLGSKNGFSDLIKHPWFRSLNVTQIRNGSLKPPITIDPNGLYFTPRRVDNDVFQDQGTSKLIALSDLELLKKRKESHKIKMIDMLPKPRDPSLMKTETLEKLIHHNSEEKQIQSQQSASQFDRKTRTTFLQVPSQADSNGLGSKARLTLSSKSRTSSPSESIMSASVERSSRYTAESPLSRGSNNSEQDFEYDTGINEIRGFDKAVSAKIGSYQLNWSVRLSKINVRSPYFNIQSKKLFSSQKSSNFA